MADWWLGHARARNLDGCGEADTLLREAHVRLDDLDPRREQWARAPRVTHDGAHLSSRESGHQVTFMGAMGHECMPVPGALDRARS